MELLNSNYQKYMRHESIENLRNSIFCLSKLSALSYFRLTTLMIQIIS